jgi:phosphoglucosamine mutase
MDIGRAAAMVVSERIGKKPVFLIGKDTRVSSDMLEAALCAGLCSVGADAVSCGVLPTPAVSYFVGTGKADAGVMLSASHNLYEYNGIKIFGSGGFKLTDEDEFEVEAIILDKVKPYLTRTGWEIGRMSAEDFTHDYTRHIAESIDGDLKGIRIAVDCSNGSASRTAAMLFSELGADVKFIHDKPDGLNINRSCGSTSLDSLQEFMKESETKFDAGIAFDGDADRCLAIDDNGEIIDGDRIMAILALDMRRKGMLAKNTLVSTVMSNMGLDDFARSHGITMERTKVGDRYVLERMRKKGYNLGGEQSGHLIFADRMNTGDGQLTAVKLLKAVKDSGKPLSELAKVMDVYPQKLAGIRADKIMKANLSVDPGAAKIIKEAQSALGKDGRIVVRPSGTEPLIRIMIEWKYCDKIEALLTDVCDKLEERLTTNEDCKQLAGL